MNQIGVMASIDLEQSIMEPHLAYRNENLQTKKRVALGIFSRKPENVLLISGSGFLESSVLAGLTGAQLEHIARFGPKNYKENVLKGFGEKSTLDEVMKIAAEMDKDTGENSNRNQQRIKSLLQYLKDNQKAFQF